MSRADIKATIRKLEQRKLSHRAIVYTLGSVRQVLACGISSGLLSVNVAASVEAPRKQHSKAMIDTRPKDESWSQQELLQFRAVADQDDDAPHSSSTSAHGSSLRLGSPSQQRNATG